MKLLHTADWHLGDVVARLDRSDDLRARVRRVAEIAVEREIDVVVIAGDLFSDHAAVTYEKMTAELDHLHDAFRPYFNRGGMILAITGNHDKEIRSEFIRAGMQLAAIPSEGMLQPGRMSFHNNPACVRYTRNNLTVQFVLLPYPFYSRYAEPGDRFESREEQNRVVKERVAKWLAETAHQPGFDPTLPTVLVAHLNVSGSETHRLYKLTERDDVCFDAGAIPSDWAYVALGHIHKPQALHGRSHVRYPGPLDRLRVDERGDPRGVLIIELNANGLVREPEWVELPPTPMHEIVLQSPADVNSLAERYPDHATAIVQIIIRHDSTVAERDEMTRELKKLFPRFAEIRWDTTEPLVEAGTASPPTRADYRETIRKYLETKLAGDPDAEAIKALAELFLQEQ